MRSLWQTLDSATTRAVVVVAASVLLIGISYGAAAHDAGWPWWQTVAIATVVLAGSSEFVLLGVVAAGGLPLLGAAAALLVNSRHLGYGLAVGELMPRGRRLLLGAHLLNDESAAMTAAEKDGRRASAVFVLCGVGVLLSWPLGALIGSVIGRLVDPNTLGLDAAFPALLIALALPALKDRTTAVAVGIGAIVALATVPFLPAGLPVVAGLIGVIITEVWSTVRRRRGVVDRPVEEVVT